MAEREGTEGDMTGRTGGAGAATAWRVNTGVDGERAKIGDECERLRSAGLRDLSGRGGRTDGPFGDMGSVSGCGLREGETTRRSRDLRTASAARPVAPAWARAAC